MTNEEAINQLQNILNWTEHHDEKEIDAYDEEAIEYAIKALEQEPMVEIDLDYVIKQKYIEREVLDKIKGEIEERKLNSGGEPNRELAFNVCLKIIDKYKAESEDKE